MTDVTFPFVLVAVACGVGCALGAYMAACRNRRVVEYALVVRERVPDHMGGDHRGGDMSDKDGQLTLDDALAQRDAVLQEVADKHAGWLAAAAAEMARLEPGIQDTGEGFRKRLLERGIRPPAHVNAWGSLFMTLTKRKVLIPTGEYRPMLDAKAHARKTPVYVLTHKAA